LRNMIAVSRNFPSRTAMLIYSSEVEVSYA
jgi:hypothetical protein